MDDESKLLEKMMKTTIKSQIKSIDLMREEMRKIRKRVERNYDVKVQKEEENCPFNLSSFNSEKLRKKPHSRSHQSRKNKKK